VLQGASFFHLKKYLGAFLIFWRTSFEFARAAHDRHAAFKLALRPPRRDPPLRRRLPRAIRNLVRARRGKLTKVERGQRTRTFDKTLGR